MEISIIYLAYQQIISSVSSLLDCRRMEWH